MSVVIQIKKYGNVSRAAKIHAKGYSHSKFMPAELYLSVLSNRNSCLTKEYTCIQNIRYMIYDILSWGKIWVLSCSRGKNNNSCTSDLQVRFISKGTPRKESSPLRNKN